MQQLVQIHLLIVQQSLERRQPAERTRTHATWHEVEACNHYNAATFSVLRAPKRWRMTAPQSVLLLLVLLFKARRKSSRKSGEWGRRSEKTGLGTSADTGNKSRCGWSRNVFLPQPWAWTHTLDRWSAGQPARLTLYLRKAAWMICAFMSSLFFAFLPPAFPPAVPVLCFLPPDFFAPNPVLQRQRRIQY